MFGGLALLIPQLSPYLSHMLLNFLIFGGILAFFWPERGWQWGLWLAIPAFTMGLINVVVGRGLGDIPESAIIVAEALIAGVVTGWLGARYSPRRLPFGGLR